MTLSIEQQALSLLCFVCLGLALGLAYDLLRPIRYHWKRDFISDLIFCAAGAGACFLFSMNSGKLGVWEIMAALLSFCLYINIFSPVILPVVLKIFEEFCRLICLIAQKSKNFTLFVKNIFTNEQN